MLKIGAYIPVGPLNRLSYQYHYSTVLDNLSDYFDELVLVSSSRESTPDQISNLNRSNIEIISDERSWSNAFEDGNEHIEFGTANKLFNLAKEALSTKKVDILVLIDINMYIRADQFQPFINYCTNLINDNELVGYRYRSLQTKDNFSVPNIRHPWVFNTHHDDWKHVSLEADEAHILNNKFRAERGLFHDAPYYFCDFFPPILNQKDYNEKFEYYIKHLNKYYNNKNQDKDWFNYIRREFNKYKSAPLMDDVVPDEWGEKMFRNIPDHSIYDYFDMLEGNAFDKMKFKLLEYKYRLNVQKKAYSKPTICRC
jgi:hypothetical protein